MKNLKVLPKKLTATEYARILFERRRREEDKIIKQAEIEAYVPPLSEEARLMLEHKERIRKLVAREQAAIVKKKWQIG